LSLTQGTRLGPYEIVSSIGAGGMGEVFRAKDARLGRDVAIKVLPASLASDASRRERFEREAKAVAALSHPNIINVFDTGLHQGHPFVVMELLEGETLRDRLTSGALPVRKAVEIAVQIARGLGAAHDRQIVHRDLKPENIFILRDGQVKILDFGLAKALGHDPASATAGATETRANITDAGIAMGTIGYMAPEQIRAQAVDGRTDLFAFGAVLFEMLSGTRAFQRETSADTMTAILKEDAPELDTTGTLIPSSLDRIVRHCLEKNPAERFQSARDVAFALEALSGTGVTRASGAVPAAVTRSRAWQTPVLVAAAVVIAAAAGLGYGLSGRPEPVAIAFESKTFDGKLISNARFGPDGQTIYFSSVGAGNRPSLFTIAPGSLTPKPLGEPGTHLLSVSSRGELAVLTGAVVQHHRIYTGTLSRMSVDGAAQPWLEDVTEADYSPDGSTLAIIRLVNGRAQLEYPIGTVLYVAPTGYISDPRVSPDSARVAFMDHPIQNDDRGTLKVVDTAKVVTTLSPEYWGEEGVAWSRDSRTVYFSPSISLTQYDVMAVNVTGAPRLRQVLAVPGTGNLFDLAPDGRALVMRGNAKFVIQALVPGETAERVFEWLDYSLGPYLSGDGKQMVFTDLSASAGADYMVARRDIGTDRVARLGPGVVYGLSPDGRWAVAVKSSTQQIVLYPTGSGDARALPGPKMSLGGRDTMDWFSDGKRIVFCGREAAAPSRCYVQSIDGGNPTVVSPDGVIDAILGPDDRTLIIRLTSGVNQRMTIGGGAPVDVKGLSPADKLLTWTSDGLSVIVTDPDQLPAPVDRVDLATGRRTRIKDLGPADVTGVSGIADPMWRADGRGYGYDFARVRAQLLVVTGLGK
jgi:Tol biopolymer transport system component